MDELFTARAGETLDQWYERVAGIDARGLS